MLEPVPAIAEAAALLNVAVDAHLAGDVQKAGCFFTAADMPQISVWANQLWSTENSSIHRYRAVEGAPPKLPKAEQDRRTRPEQAVARQLLARDGHHCQFCGIPVISTEVRAFLSKRYTQVRWGGRNPQQHAAFQAMQLVFDHVLPRSRGGCTTFDNLVVACQPCNCGRRERTLDEVGLLDPRDLATYRSEWDGLERVMTKATSSGSLAALDSR
jgi:5-methylcytosine-specific restriction endonuclease McrA